MTENYDEKKLRRFLLGELDDDEQIRIEDAAFADAELFALIQTVENDLIDEYAREELKGAEKENFERVFLTSEERLRKIEFARTFKYLEDKNSSPAKAVSVGHSNEKNSFQTNFLDLLFKPQFALAAVVLLLFIAGAWFLTSSHKQSDEIAGRANGNVVPTATLSMSNDNRMPDAVNTQTNIQSNNSPNKISTPEKTNQTRPESSPSPKNILPAPERAEIPAQTFAALIFPAGLTRDGGKLRQLKLAPQTTTARLIFALEKGDDAFKNYRLEIKSSAGVLQSQTIRRGNSAAFNFPASKLSAGKYEAVLRGLGDNDQNEIIGYYDFQIIKP